MSISDLATASVQVLREYAALADGGRGDRRARRGLRVDVPAGLGRRRSLQLPTGIAGHLQRHTSWTPRVEWARVSRRA